MNHLVTCCGKCPFFDRGEDGLFPKCKVKSLEFPDSHIYPNFYTTLPNPEYWSPNMQVHDDCPLIEEDITVVFIKPTQSYGRAGD